MTAAAGLTESLAAELTVSYARLHERKVAFLTTDNPDKLPPLPEVKTWLESVREERERLIKESIALSEEADSEGRKNAEVQVNELLAKQWVAAQGEAILEEIQRTKSVALLDEALRLTKTTALSTKKGELAESLITEAFVTRFQTELDLLGARQLRVELARSKVSKGRVLHRLRLKAKGSIELREVLSEGERRVISLAAFLADVGARAASTPAILDDPVSSLDHVFEEAVVKRLIDLSKSRQVVVFTHRLASVGLFRFHAQRKNCGVDVVHVRTADWGAGEPAPLPLSMSDMKKGLNLLANDRLQKVKKARSASDFEQADSDMKAMCSEFRRLIERSVEMDLLQGVVTRFDRGVSTLKVMDLATLTQDDCRVLDDLMTKYSAFEHDQPPEAQVALPSAEDFLQDVQTLQGWREEYKKRSV